MEALFLNLLALTGPVSALIALLLAITPLMRRSYAAKWRQYMWIFCAVRLLFPVKLFSSSLYTIELPPESAAAAPSSAAAAITPPDFNPLTILAAVWLFGAAVFLTAQLVSYIAFRHNIKRLGAICSNEETVKIFTVSKAAMGIKGKISLRICRTLKSPMVTGFFNPVLLLPREDYGADEAEIIIRHELIHFKKHHLWHKLLLLLTKSVSWFNPFVYAMFRAADKDMELACDDEVIRGSDYAFRRRYCETILNGIHKERGCANALTTCLNVSKKTLMDRFGNILNTGVKKNGVIICLAVSVSLIAGGALVSFAEGRVSGELSEAFDYEPEAVMDAVINAAAAQPPANQPDKEPAAVYPDGHGQSEPDADIDYGAADEYDEAGDIPGRVYDDPEPYENTPAYEGAEAYVTEPEVSGEIRSGGTQPYSSSESGGEPEYADISIDESRSFEGEEITGGNSRTITVETGETVDSGDSFTAYIHADDNGYELVRTEE